MSATIFIVEDDSVIRSVLGQLLQHDGHTVHTATSAEEALSLAASFPHPPDLVLTDLGLPGADGNRLVRDLHALAGWAKVPMIVLTARSGENDIVQALDNGADDYLVKPFHPGELLARVRKSLRHRLDETTSP